MIPTATMALRGMWWSDCEKIRKASRIPIAPGVSETNNDRLALAVKAAIWARL